jgi:hypothetical protein
VCEGLGFESGLDKKFHEAPVFYWLYTVLIVVGAGALLIPRLPLVYVSVLTQVVNGIVLPFVLIFMLLLTNDRELMGEHTNGRAFNIIAWTTVVVVIAMTLAMFFDRRQSKDSPGRSSMTVTPAALTSSRSLDGVPVSSGNVAKCIGTTSLTPSHSHAFAACSGPIV